jgi:hypothetical protein
MVKYSAEPVDTGFSGRYGRLRSSIGADHNRRLLSVSFAFFCALPRGANPALMLRQILDHGRPHEVAAKSARSEFAFPSDSEWVYVQHES